MSISCNLIQEMIDYKRSDAEKWYVGHERFVQVRGVMIKVILSKEDFDNAKN